MQVYELHSISESLCRTLVACIQDACGDGIKTDIRVNRLKTQNSKPTRIWDLINTAICEKLLHLNCVADKTKRGNWELIAIYDSQTQTVFTLMREARLKQLWKMDVEKRKWHYVTELTSTLNSDLYAKDKQVAMGFVESRSEAELTKMREIVASILQDINVSVDVVRHHALVLFNAVGFDVQSVRCVMVDGDLDIVDEESWSKYLVVSDSSVPDVAMDKDSVYNNPTQGLHLTEKAKERKGQKSKIAHKTDAETMETKE